MIDRHSSPSRWTITATLVLIVLIAAALRLWRLPTLPGGLHFDEAAYGLQAQGHILKGETPVFFSDYAGREALFQYTIAPFLVLLGPTILAVRLPAALWSIALVPAVFVLGSRLWGWRSGLLAALAVACGPWLLHIGRTGYRANTLPLVSSLAIYMLYRALHPDPRRSDRAWLLSGALFGLSLYTYAVVRVLPLLGPLLLVYLALWHRDRLRRSGRGIALFSLALAIVSAPYVYHMLRVPSDWFERFQQVSITEAEGSRAALLLQNLRLTLTMFGVRGVADDFMRLSFRPVFVGVAALPFYAGVAVALWRWRDLASGLVLLWLGVMLLPIVLASETQLHWIHAIGAAPATYLVWGLGAATSWEWLRNRLRWRPQLVAAGGWLIALVIAGWWTQATSREYFVSWAQRPDVYYDYMQYATDAARAAEQVPADQSLLISEDYYRHATYLFLAPRTERAQWFDARSAVVWPRSAPWTALVSASTPTTDDIAPLLAGAQGEPYAPDGLYSYIALRGTTIPPFTPPTPLVARFGDVLELQGIDLRGSLEPGATLHLQLYNRALGAPGRELRLFVHVEDERFRVVAQQDALGYDAREWQPGDQFISFHTLTMPAEPSAGRLRLVVGLYDAISGERYTVSGAGAQGDFIELPVP